MTILNTENYRQGFLVDDELMAGVTQHPEDPTAYVAFVLQPDTGEYLGYQPFSALDSAIQAINCIPRSWKFEKVGGCGGCGESGKAGSCSPGGCGGGKCGKEGTCKI